MSEGRTKPQEIRFDARLSVFLVSFLCPNKIPIRK